LYRFKIGSFFVTLIKLTIFEDLPMPYTTEEGGRLNNYATEPKVYKAEPPTSKQKVTYAVLAVGAIALLGGVFFIAFTVS
jgi:hypothetical protein